MEEVNFEAESADTERVDELAEESETNDNPEEYVLHKLEEGKIAEYLAKKGTIKPKESTKVERSRHGVVAVIYYTDSETGITYYLLEQNKIDYIPREEAGKIRPIGGARDYINGRLEGSLEALAREFGEEFKSSVAANAVIKALYESGEKYTTVEDIVNGKVAYTDVYIIELKSKKDWRAVEKSGSRGDTGIFRGFDRETTLSLPNQYYASGSADFIKNFVYQNIVTHKNNMLTLH